MTTGPSNPANNRPLDPDLEADLLAWVEGEPLPRARDAAVARALEADPALAARMLAMRADRQALRSLPDEPAPAGLLEAALASLEPAMERQMLLGLAEGKPLHDGPPRSIVQPQRQSLWQTFMADRLGRRLSLAAALLLVVGGTAYFAASSLNTGPTIPPSPRPGQTDGLRIAQSDARPEPDLDTTPDSTIALSAPADTREFAARAGQAAAEEPGPLADAAVLAQAPEPEAAEFDDESFNTPIEVAQLLRELDEAAAEEAGMTADHALALAREGRLAIRVVGTHPNVAIHQLERRLGRRAGASWRLAGEVPASVIAAVASAGPPAVLCPAAAKRDQALTLASVQQPLRIAMPTPTSAPVIPAIVPEPNIAPEARMAEVRLDPEVLEVVRNAIGRAAGGEAVFEELPDPLPAKALPASPASVFWWTRPASEWTGWARVPVVVEAP